MNATHPPSLKQHAALAVAVAALCSWPTQAQAEVLRCQVRYASDTVLLEARPVADPYTVAAQDIGGRFRFKAVVVGNPQAPQQIDHIALYAYDMEMPGAPLLIHQVVHTPPFADQPALPGLTGWNHIYSAHLGREMVYGCALSKESP